MAATSSYVHGILQDDPLEHIYLYVWKSAHIYFLKKKPNEFMVRSHSYTLYHTIQMSH